MSFDAEVQRKAEAHLAACNEALWDELETSPAVGPYCGCDTCVVREVLTVCWDEMMEEARRVVAAEGADLAGGALPGLRLVQPCDAVRGEPRSAHD